MLCYVMLPLWCEQEEEEEEEPPHERKTAEDLEKWKQEELHK